MAGLSHCTSAPWLVCHIVHLPHDWLLPSGDLAINQSVSLLFVTHIVFMGNKQSSMAVLWGWQPSKSTSVSMTQTFVGLSLVEKLSPLLWIFVSFVYFSPNIYSRGKNVFLCNLILNSFLLGSVN